MELASVLVGVAILVGLLGIIVPVLPGLILVVGAVAIWALLAQSSVGWFVLAAALVLSGTGWMIQYVIPGRRLERAGIPRRTMVFGALGAIVGFFVVPVAGLLLGFALGVVLAEVLRLRGLRAAWPSAVHVLQAAAMSFGIELVTATLVAMVWAVGVWRYFA